MGLDFIRERAKSFRKSWDRHRIELCQRSLFTKDPEGVPRTALARTREFINSDSSLLVRAERGGLVGYQRLTPVAVFVDPPSDLVDAVLEAGGYAEGQVVAEHDENVAEIAIC